MTDSAIRLMQPNDLKAVMAIAAASPEAPGWQESDYTAYLGPAQPPLLRMALVAEAGGRVLGFAAASLLLDGTGNRCELDTVAVDPGSRRAGVGSALLEAVIGWAGGHGACRLTLEVRAGNAAAICLYRRLGFAEEGRRARYYAQPVEDALLLGRKVTAVSPQD
jgi:[ribosomal protein S18]-alanine N-acetyltransferase